MPHQKHVDILEGNQHFYRKVVLVRMRTAFRREAAFCFLRLVSLQEHRDLQEIKSDLIIIVKDQRPHEGRINSKFKGQGFASPTMKVNHSLA